jgi:hypothetical protein
VQHGLLKSRRLLENLLKFECKMKYEAPGSISLPE